MATPQIKPTDIAGLAPTAASTFGNIAGAANLIGPSLPSTFSSTIGTATKFNPFAAPVALASFLSALNKEGKATLGPLGEAPDLNTLQKITKVEPVSRFDPEAGSRVTLADGSIKTIDVNFKVAQGQLLGQANATGAFLGANNELIIDKQAQVEAGLSTQEDVFGPAGIIALGRDVRPTGDIVPGTRGFQEQAGAFNTRFGGGVAGDAPDDTRVTDPVGPEPGGVTAGAAGVVNQAIEQNRQPVEAQDVSVTRARTRERRRRLRRAALGATIATGSGRGVTGPANRAVKQLFGQ